MSIILKNVEWHQTNDEITVKIPIKGKKSLDDIILSEKFVKINISPYYYEVFFEQSICVEKSVCKLLESCIKLVLKKANCVWWPSLGKSSTNKEKSSENMISIESKKEFIDEYEKSYQKDLEDRKRERSNLKRGEIEKETTRQQELNDKIEKVEKQMKEKEIALADSNKKSWIKTTEAVESVAQSKLEQNLQTKPSKTITPVRSFGTINVTFSARRFITPQRESQEHAEREWCMKQYEAMTKTIGFCDDDLSADERDPRWLLNKGNEFYDKKNYWAALSAYSSGIKLAKESAVLYIGRARAHFQLENYSRCAEDASTAYDLFQPAVSSNLKDRTDCLWLRGKSLIELGYIDHGRNELQAANRLDPSNKELIKDLSEIESKIQNK